MKKLEDYVISIPDFPKPGILFRDVTGVLASGEGFHLAVEEFCRRLERVDFDLVIGMESRGFLFGAPVACRLGKGFVPVRKPGKLPRETIAESYDLEYGQATLEVHKDDIRPGQKIVIVDDLLATGGTAEAAAKLVERLGGTVVKMVFLIELVDLGGRAKLAKYPVDGVIGFPGH
ncbi:MAG: adenine phosphoribosyltransferase [Kiritimatiellia bacterium]